MFVDATGRRRRRVRRIAYAVGVACLTYTGLVGASVLGHPARPGALAPLPATADGPRPAVRQIRPPDRPEAGVPLPPGDRPDLEAAPVRLRRREPAQPAAPASPSAPRIESTPLPTPTTAPQPSLEPEPEPTDPPEPMPTDPPEPTPTDPPTTEPTQPPAPEPTPDEPLAGLPVVGPILGLLSGGSAGR